MGTACGLLLLCFVLASAVMRFWDHCCRWGLRPLGSGELRCVASAPFPAISDPIRPLACEMALFDLHLGRFLVSGLIFCTHKIGGGFRALHLQAQGIHHGSWCCHCKCISQVRCTFVQGYADSRAIPTTLRDAAPHPGLLFTEKNTHRSTWGTQLRPYK